MGKNRRIGRRRIVNITWFCVSFHLYVHLQFLSPLNFQYDEYKVGTTPNHILNTRMQNSIQRGGFLTTLSGCRISVWIVSTRDHFRYRDCIAQSESGHSELNNVMDLAQVQENDTIYVTLHKLQWFVDVLLSEIRVNVVIVSGQWHKIDAVDSDTVKKLLSHNYILHWFCQNVDIYGGSDLNHTRLSPWPYGLMERPYHENNHLSVFEEVFKSNVTKRMLIYAGFLAKTARKRKAIPHSKTKLTPRDFYLDIAKSHYVISPNGDRSECYRHYEAIGLGTVPITELHPALFRHLSEGPVIYNTTNWNLAYLEAVLDPSPVVNRDLVLEEYWIKWANRVVGVDLNWMI